MYCTCKKGKNFSSFSYIGPMILCFRTRVFRSRQIHSRFYFLETACTLQFFFREGGWNTSSSHWRIIEAHFFCFIMFTEVLNLISQERILQIIVLPSGVYPSTIHSFISILRTKQRQTGEIGENCFGCCLRSLYSLCTSLETDILPVEEMLN